MGTKERILEAADELFGEVGFDGASTRKIAARSGANKALIHYHFKTKEGLLGSVLDRYYQRLGDTLSQSIAQSNTLRERIAAMIEAYSDFLSRNRNFSRIVQRESSGGKNLERIGRHMKPLFETGRELMDETYPGIQNTDMAASQLLITFYGMIVSYFSYSEVLSHLLDTDPLSPESLARRKKHVHGLMDIVFAAIAKYEVPQTERQHEIKQQ
ncbi:MAG: TetR/AcrR family transcriptional regulator [Candidatus Lernaella stagnicola]|nr:TetR/AcrR family transcriptional regulator [Candidatus Lernaella stagnicola]